MSIEFKEEMKFSEIEADFIPQLKAYLKRSKNLLVDVDIYIYQLIRMPRVILNFMIDGLGKDEDNNANFVNYIKACYCFIYSSNTDVIEFVNMRGTERQQLYDFKLMHKDLKTCNTEKIFRHTDLAQIVIEQKTGLRIRYEIAFKFALMIGEFINAYMKAKGIKKLKIEALDENGNPIIIDPIMDEPIPPTDIENPTEDTKPAEGESILEGNEYEEPVIPTETPTDDVVDDNGTGTTPGDNTDQPTNPDTEVPTEDPKPDDTKPEEPTKDYEFIYQRNVWNSAYEV